MKKLFTSLSIYLSMLLLAGVIADEIDWYRRKPVYGRKLLVSNYDNIRKLENLSKTPLINLRYT